MAELSVGLAWFLTLNLHCQTLGHLGTNYEDCLQASYHSLNSLQGINETTGQHGKVKRNDHFQEADITFEKQYVEDNKKNEWEVTELLPENFPSALAVDTTSFQHTKMMNICFYIQC